MAEQDRFAAVADHIRNDINPHIIAVQELLSCGADGDHHGATPREGAERSLRQLAEATGLHCHVGLTPALAMGRARRHVGLLFRDGIDPILGSLMCCDSDRYNIQNGLVAAVFDVGGAKLRAGSAHTDVRDPGFSGWHEAGIAMYALNRPDYVGICGGDWQGIGADSIYDPDPYMGGALWAPAFAYQLGLDRQVDRSLAIRLEHNARFKDCARVAGLGWKPTTGHHPSDPHRIAPRRPDRVYVTHDFPDDAVEGVDVPDLADAKGCSDHIPVAVRIDETKLPS